MNINKPKWIKIIKPTNEIRLYRRGEVPADLKSRGVWGWYGKEWLFCPFGGSSQEEKSNFDWECKNCGRKWYYNDLIKNYEAHCPSCGLWIGLKGLKFNGHQKRLEEF